MLVVTRLTAAESCRIEVVDKQNGWPVPLVELRTTHQMRFVTDNAGVIALEAPELMGREVWFEVHGHGYEVPKDGFGMRGIRWKPEPGKILRLELNRTIIAQRLGRITGGGIFAESQKLGRELHRFAGTRHVARIPRKTPSSKGEALATLALMGLTPPGRQNARITSLSRFLNSSIGANNDVYLDD